MALTSDEERTHLAQSDQHIAEGEQHIAEQEARIALLRADGHDVTAFEDVLGTMRATLKEHCAHRATILSRIAQCEAAAPGEGRMVS